MARWGGIRENAGRPPELNVRKGKLIYLEEVDLKEFNYWVQILQDAGEETTGNDIIRMLLSGWLEEQRERYPNAAKKFNPETV